MGAWPDLENLIHPRLPLPDPDSWSVDLPLAMALAEHVLREKPRFVLELGSGLSTLVIAYCLERNRRGRSLSLEHEYYFRTRTKLWLLDHALTDCADVALCPLVPVEAGTDRVWYMLPETLSQSPPIDLLFIDGPPGYVCAEARRPALPLLRPLLAPESSIIVDDANRADEAAMIRDWRRDYAELSCASVLTSRGYVVLSRATGVLSYDSRGSGPPTVLNQAGLNRSALTSSGAKDNSPRPLRHDRLLS